MASQELARWRELQAQHQLEMIRKNELDLLQRAKSVVMKTHKGEQVNIRSFSYLTVNLAGVFSIPFIHFRRQAY